MSAKARWIVLVAVLVVAAGIAFWPRGGEQRQVDQANPAPLPTINLEAARAKAHLPGCPQPSGTAEVAQLRGISATCLANNAPVDLGSALAGHTTLINVWATWCTPCQQELPVLADYAARPGAVQVLTVQFRSAPADGLDLLAGLNVRLPTVHDDNEAVTRALHLPATLPASYLVTQNGKVHMVTTPRLFTSPDEVATAVKAQ